MKSLLSLLSSSGTVSSMRYASFIVVNAIMIILIVLNVASACKSFLGTPSPIVFVDLPTNCMVALGIVLGAKVAQKPFEKNGNGDKDKEKGILEADQPEK